MLTFALFGAGRIGRLHAANIAAHPKARLGLVADVAEEAAQAVAAQHGASVGSVEEALASDRIDAVLIATSTDTHAPLIEAAAAAGKAILCEKPIDLDIARATAAVRTASAAGVPLAVGFNRRFDASFAALKARLDAGDIGTPEIVSIASRDPSPPPLAYVRVSGGLFRDMMIHDLDMARWLLGEEPIEVHAMGSALVDPAIADAGDVDTALVSLRTASGRLAQISNSRRAAYGYDQRIECHGSKGMLRADNLRGTTVEIATAAGYVRDPILHFFLERYGPAYRAELDAFVEAVLTGREPAPTGEDGLAALRLADAAQQSLETGTPVRLPAS
ncbi:Myo-inositol 2-dehydrogenase [alpha proteobacterium BAL199]|jgi:myo-inositol 2-dehydrogenase / D-chiro-inositol 1-dehydrogenase|nr:Myo-inositol 2-dehydrogenase [alpha proteobacterium BAL199]